jgi:isopenicillin N synthase-like dioxygenase
MSAHTIPVLDLSSYISGTPQQRQQFIEALGRSLCDIGFFALTNHGIEKADIDASYKVTSDLFDLPDTVKAKYEIPGINGQRAYTSFGKEHAKDSSAPDLKEFWHIGQELSKDHPLAKSYPENLWPSEVDNFQSTMLNIYQKLDQCALTLLEACSLYLGEDKNLIRNMAQDGNSILRLIHYPPVPTDANPQSVRAAAHEDINLITLLIEATDSGLEILDRNDNWIPVVTPKGCIIVDAGDMLQNLTNGFFKSTTHRVVNPDDSRSRRFSMPYFVHARSEVRLDPLQSCIDKHNGVRRHPNITAGEYLHQRLVEIGLA